jgi:hypothetical protein
VSVASISFAFCRDNLRNLGWFCGNFAALTQFSLRGFWSSSPIDGQKKAGFCPLDKLHTSVPYPKISIVTGTMA